MTPEIIAAIHASAPQVVVVTTVVDRMTEVHRMTDDIDDLPASEPLPDEDEHEPEDPALPQPVDDEVPE